MMSDRPARPSKKQKELLNFIDGFIKGYGYGPSYREIMRALNYKSVSTVANHVDGLITRGYLVKKDNSARSLTVVGAANQVDSGRANSHSQWLESRIIDTIDSYDTPLSAEARENIEILIKACSLLNVPQAKKAVVERLSHLTNR